MLIWFEFKLISPAMIPLLTKRLNDLAPLYFSEYFRGFDEPIGTTMWGSFDFRKLLPVPAYENKFLK